MDSSDFESDSDSGADLEPPLSPDLVLSEPSSGTSTSQPKHTIGARIQALTFLELNIHRQVPSFFYASSHSAYLPVSE